MILTSTSATTIAAGSASETEASRSVRDTGRRSKSRTIGAGITALFRRAVKAVTGHSEDELRPARRRRRGETGGEFRKLARALARRFDPRKLRGQFKKRSRWLAGRRQRTLRLPIEAWGPPDAHLTDTLDLLRQWNGDAGTAYGGDLGTAYDAPSDNLSPRL